MGFWSGETLLSKLPGLVDPFSPGNVDCAAYTLTIGRELYVSPTAESEDPKSITLRHLGDGEAFAIPPGQFAFLQTEEIVKVPADALAFISIKAKIKFRGLVNVSGFHVDPGFRGRLIFSVFNAGPVSIHLKQGQQCFLMWYASLDGLSERIRKAPPQMAIEPEFINSISGELQSLEGLHGKIKEVEKTLVDRVHKVERDHTRLLVTASTLLTLLLAVIGGFVTVWIRGDIGPKNVRLEPSLGVVTPTPLTLGTPAAPKGLSAGPPRTDAAKP